MIETGRWDAKREKGFLAELGALVAAAIQGAEEAPLRSPATMFDDVYAEVPGSLAAQAKTLGDQ